MSLVSKHHTLDVSRHANPHFRHQGKGSPAASCRPTFAGAGLAEQAPRGRPLQVLAHVWLARVLPLAVGQRVQHPGAGGHCLRHKRCQGRFAAAAVAVASGGQRRCTAGVANSAMD